MLKYTRESHQDYLLLKESLQFIKEGLTEINRNTSNVELEHCKKMITVEKTIDGDFAVSWPFSTFAHDSRHLYIQNDNIFEKAAYF